jgi:hypothetical protein
MLSTQQQSKTVFQLATIVSTRMTQQQQQLTKTQSLNITSPADPRAATLPAAVRSYHTLVPLDAPNDSPLWSPDSRALGRYPTHLYKCLNSVCCSLYSVVVM